ncbi:RagB/SusD family nutrient uptake outer membrane protein [Salegentibacter maritimus]|uniref:RagB/SusD family nutrient uptake outer membrane protein n=1 Tax=Salegentibacter maritimus TaxID=2794347 RepID=UPI0018E4CFF0|nr:RagB/SusD family nutrient uptake outer membrane protein [Salegentibacter maritimus]MBI6116827.1 RagB/SusD family nutrient uptake outer membrane protein [Salegentibacter maritimus]
MKFIYIVLALFVLSSCDSQLEIDAPSELTYNGFWESENGARAAHSGLYGTFRGAANTFWVLGAIRSDVWGGQTFESPFYQDLIESNITVSTAPFGGWGGFYSRIHKLNDFIQNVPNIEFNNPEDKEHMLGQAYGLRAYYYYTLLKTWGPVPISEEILSTTSPDGLSKGRSSEEEVMQFIKADIQRSLDAFGDDASFWNGNKNYWSKAATLTLKGDAYIWSGNLLGGGNTDFTEAKNALEQVGQIANVGLVESYTDLWGADNENNSEFIFAIQYAEDEAGNFYNAFTGRSTEIWPQFDEDGNSMEGFIIAGSNRYGPSEKTLLLSDDNLDARKDQTFIRLYSDSNNGAGYPNYNANKYFGSVLNKFLGRVDGSVRIFDSDIPVYRYADVVLLMAEAKNYLGEDPSSEINLIRERAYGDDYDPAIHAYSNGSKAENTEAILNERYVEFIAEGKRWWDLRRAGDQYVIDNVEFLDEGDEYKLKLPITLDMIGRNPLLEQTEGYE